MTPQVISERLLELAERCEAATGPDRELMCAAFKAVFPEVSSGAWGAIGAWDTRYDRFSAMLDVGASLDAAMTLVPEGMSANLGNDVQCWANIWHDIPAYDGLPFEGRAATLPLAICAAALRATEYHHGE